MTWMHDLAAAVAVTWLVHYPKSWMMSIVLADAVAVVVAAVVVDDDR